MAIGRDKGVDLGLLRNTDQGPQLPRKDRRTEKQASPRFSGTILEVWWRGEQGHPVFTDSPRLEFDTSPAIQPSASPGPPHDSQAPSPHSETPSLEGTLLTSHTRTCAHECLGIPQHPGIYIPPAYACWLAVSPGPWATAQPVPRTQEASTQQC